MDQQLRLPLEPFPNGLTEWRQGRPPFIGWWDTRPILATTRVSLTQRRWWSGNSWSVPVMIGDDDDATMVARCRVGATPAAMIEYRGLAEPPKEGYSWALDEHHRSNLAAASRARVPLVA